MRKLLIILSLALVLTGCQRPDMSTVKCSEELFGGSFSYEDVPAYSGEPYVELNGGVPYFTKDEITAALTALDENAKYGLILRSKGIVAGENGEWIHFDYVPGESEVRTASSDVTGKIVVIGSEVKKDAVKALFGI